MNRDVKSIILLVLLIVIPLLFYAYLQVQSLNEDEKTADAIYEKQMEAVLFSLNQYADDMTSLWIRKLSNQEKVLHKNATDLVLGNESIQLLVVRKMNTATDRLYYNDYVNVEELVGQQSINAWYQKNDTMLLQLSRYISNGFQKIQAVENWNNIEESISNRHDHDVL